MPRSAPPDDGDASHDGQLYCTCPHTCGIGGKWLFKRTYYHHQETTRELEARSATRMSSPEPGPSVSVSRRSPHQARQPDDAEIDTGQVPDGGDDFIDNLELEDGDGDIQMDHEINSRSPSRSQSPFDVPSSPMNNLTLDMPSPSRDQRPETPNRYDTPSPSPDPNSDPPTEPEPVIEEFIITNKFIDGLRSASLDDGDELDPDFVERLRNPPEYTPELDADERLSVDLFLSL
ncbi:hypothetical protein B0H11DRAFT_2201145, partial [Mycena galericulata]